MNEKLVRCLKIIKTLKEKLKQAGAQIAYIKNHDHLTGSLHFPILKELLQKRIEEIPDEGFCALLINIDNFGYINDAIGREKANLLLCQLSKRIFEFLNSNVIYSRKNGGEFTLILFESNIQTISEKTKKMLKLLAQPFSLEHQIVHVTVSIGVSRYPEDAKNIDTLFENANIALQHSKYLGVDNYQYYSARIGHRAHYIGLIQKELLYAFEKHEFLLHYQPLVEIKTHRIIGAEALLRWKHPVLGYIYPIDFIPLLEKTEQIISVGDWVLEQACLQAKKWQTIDRNLRITINVSSKQLMASLARNKFHIVTRIKHLLKKIDLRPESLELEVTENAIVHDDKTTKNNLKALKKMGVHISCDDFGMGYASFNRLRQLYLDTIKIDKSLISDIDKNSIDCIIVKSILALGKQMNVDVIAEGVRNEKIANALLEMGCIIGQGYFFNKPVSAQKFTNLLRKQNL